MLYSFMSFSTPALTLTEMLDTARRFGYDGIEPRIDAKHSHGVEVNSTQQQRQAVHYQCAASGIRLACIATSLSYADPATVSDMVHQTHERIDLAGDVGAPAIRVFGGRIPEGLTREAAIDQVVAALSEVAGHAAERNVLICMETHDDWSDAAHVAAVLGRVDHPNVAANWDILHPVRAAGRTMDEAWEAIKPWIKHVHIHDCVGKDLAPIGTGNIDHHRAVELLEEIDYRGFISGEWINWEPYETHLPRELAAMKSYER